MEQALYKAAILTFEELGFIFPVERLPEEVFARREIVSVGVKFSGNFSGEMILRIENSILPTLAANMLGDDEQEFDREIQLDVLGELTNVICGNALPEIAGRQEIFRLEAPQILTEPELGELPAAIARLDVEESKVDVLLYIN